MQKIVVIGGGSGIFNVLKGLKFFEDVEVTVLVSVADDGGSSGLLRDEYGFLPAGDVRKSLVALSNTPKIMRDLFNYRFKEGSVSGHSFGNLFLTALNDVAGSFEQAIATAGKILNVRGKVYPISLNNFRLCAELSDGSIVKGETNIDVPKHDPTLKIKKLFLDSEANIFSKARRAILNADKIVIGPGDLYTSLVPNLLVKGVVNSITDSSAKKIYVCNLMTKYGETDGFKVGDFLQVLSEYVSFDYILINKVKFYEKVLEKYSKEKAFPVEIDVEGVLGEFAEIGEIIRHHPYNTAKVIVDL
jgi:uncharacterized cofD-like protein